jgi:unspecific monooxygenase
MPVSEACFKRRARRLGTECGDPDLCGTGFGEARIDPVSSGRPLVLFPSSMRAAPRSGRVIARELKENALAVFPPEAFEEDVIVRRFFGHQQLILNRPAGIHRVLVENAENYRRTPATMRLLLPLLGKGLLLAEGEDWKHQRRTVAPALAPRMIPVLVRHVADAAGAMITKFTGPVDRHVDLFAEMQFLALDIAGRSMFSLAMERHGREMRELVTAYAEHLARPTLLDFLLPLAVPSPRDFARRRFRRRWMDLIRRIVVEREAAAPKVATGDLFDLLSTASAPESGERFSVGRLADQVATLIIAGHETTAVALFWALHLVASLPPVEALLATEVAGLDLGPDGAAETLSRLTYTRAVVQEALRLYPPVFALVRQARKADVAGGIPVAARAVVFISPWVLHRHRRLWARPDTFDPARFLPGAAPPDRFAYLPFGIGPRVCVGAQFALTEATLVLAKMIQAFRISRAGDEAVVPVGIITTQPDHPALFRLQPRH